MYHGISVALPVSGKNRPSPLKRRSRLMSSSWCLSFSKAFSRHRPNRSRRILPRRRERRAGRRPHRTCQAIEHVAMASGARLSVLHRVGGKRVSISPFATNATKASSVRCSPFTSHIFYFSLFKCAVIQAQIVISRWRTKSSITAST